MEAWRSPFMMVAAGYPSALARGGMPRSRAPFLLTFHTIYGIR
jgi:hypothetical protein